MWGQKGGTTRKAEPGGGELSFTQKPKQGWGGRRNRDESNSLGPREKKVVIGKRRYKGTRKLDRGYLSGVRSFFILRKKEF